MNFLYLNPDRMDKEGVEQAGEQKNGMFNCFLTVDRVKRPSF